MEMLQEGWHDLGAEAGTFGRKANQPTCKQSEGSQENRRDYIIVNPVMWPKVDDFDVDQEALFHTHKVVQMVFNIKRQPQDLRQVKPIGSLAEMHKVQGERDTEELEGKEKKEAEEEHR